MECFLRGISMGYSERYTLEEMWYDDAGAFTFDNDELRGLVAEALTKVPMRIADIVHKKCRFFMDDNSCYYIPAKQIWGKALIYLSKAYIDSIEREEAVKTILHEIAHFYYRHDYRGIEMTLDKTNQCEAQADRLVELWLSGGGRSYNKWVF